MQGNPCANSAFDCEVARPIVLLAFALLGREHDFRWSWPTREVVLGGSQSDPARMLPREAVEAGRNFFGEMSIPGSLLPEVFWRL